MKKKKPNDIPKTLKAIYTNVKSPGGLGGIQAVWRQAKKIHPKITISTVTGAPHREHLL